MRYSLSLSYLTSIVRQAVNLSSPCYRHSSQFAVGAAILALSGLVLPIRSAQADILWDQSSVDLGQGLIDHEVTNFQSGSTYLVGDVSFAQNVKITDIYTYNAVANFTYSAPTISVGLTFFPKLGATPPNTISPANLGIFTAAFSRDGDVGTIRLSNLPTELASVVAGSYWVGLTPISDTTVTGQTYHYATTTMLGEGSYSRNPGGAFGKGTGWILADDWSSGFHDIALRIDGKAVVVPESSTLLLTSLMLATMGTVLFYRNKKAPAP